MEAVSMVENFQENANIIWQVADDILPVALKQHEYPIST